MSDVLGGDLALTVIILLERKDHEHAIYKLLHAPDASLLPRPQLGRHEIDHRHAHGMKLRSEPEIEIWEVNEDGDIRYSRSRNGHGSEELAIDACDVLHYLADSYCGDLRGIDHSVASCCAHPFAANAEELRVISQKLLQFGDKHRPVLLAGSLAGRDEDARCLVRGRCTFVIC